MSRKAFTLAEILLKRTKGDQPMKNLTSKITSRKPMTRKAFTLAEILLKRMKGDQPMKKLVNRTTKGFTLAEILITLTVIGVVAALTIPTLLQNTNQAELKAAYKKAFGDGSQALIISLAQGELQSCTGQTDHACHLNNYNAFKSKFRIIKECTTPGSNSNCWDGTEKFSSDTPNANAFAFIDSAGRSWSMRCAEATCASEYIFIDVNGFKTPNKYGRDKFIVEMNSNETDGDVGIPLKLYPRPDRVQADVYCPSGNCFFTSWLYN